MISSLKDSFWKSISYKGFNGLKNSIVRRGLLKDLQYFENKGLKITTIYDVGAHKGDWARKMRRHFKEARFILFEANPVHQTSLQATGLQYYCAALADKIAQKPFYADGGSGDSFYREAGKRYENVEPQTFETTTLAALKQKEDLPVPQLLKIDTQGSELDILAGFSGEIEKVALVYLECPLEPYNIGAPDSGDYLSFMRSHGFTPYAINEFHRVRGQLVQIDILFVNKKIIDINRI